MHFKQISDEFNRLVRIVVKGITPGAEGFGFGFLTGQIGQHVVTVAMFFRSRVIQLLNSRLGPATPHTVRNISSIMKILFEC